jgi:hypothetical protein
VNTPDELEAIRARYEADPYDRSQAVADRATFLRLLDAAREELREVKAERSALRALCLEAAEFYGYGGTFPIRGVMAMRLTGAALGTLATALAKDAPHKGTPMLIDGDERTTVRIFTPYDPPTRAQGESS